MTRRTLYLSGVVRPHLHAMLQPGMGNLPPAGMKWAADNGRFSRPDTYTNEAYLAWLSKKAKYLDACLFATAPDVVGDWRATLELSLPMLPRIRALGYPAALVAQDGLEASGELNDDLWDEFDALFIGGSTTWKLSEAAYALVAEANDRGKWTHMGRVNSFSRYTAARLGGYDSVDGTGLRFERDRPVGEWEEWARQRPSLWEVAS